VATLLNDGHRTFSRVGPEAFPEAFRENRASWSITTEHTTDAAGTPLPSGEDICSETGSFLYLRPRARFTASWDSRLTDGLLLVSHSGRAPPCEAPHF
jgi:hypothetical protein